MDKLNLNEMLNRQPDVIKMKETLKDFEINKHNHLFKKGIYVIA